MKRVKVNDPIALCQMSIWCDREEDYVGEFEYLTKAAGLGDVIAHFRLSCMYHNGEVEKDIKKEVYHMEEAAIGGHPIARFNLGNHEGRNGRADRAFKHWIIAANQGFVRALEHLKENFRRGFLSKEDY
jgi:TPR repeat protein